MSFFKVDNSHRFTLHEWKSEKLLAKLVQVSEHEYRWVDPLDIRYPLAIFNPGIYSKKVALDYLVHTACLEAYQEEHGIAPGTDFLIRVCSVNFPDSEPMSVRARHGNPPPVTYLMKMQDWTTKFFKFTDFKQI